MPDIKEMEPAGNGFRTIRVLTGLPVRAFARKLGISHTYWNDLEAGIRKNPSKDLLNRVSEVTGLSENTVEFLTTEDLESAKDTQQAILAALEDHIKKLKLDRLAR